MSIQGFSNGGQMRDLFAAYNKAKGSTVVDMSRNYNTGDKYYNRISTGNQVDLAFAEINANESGNPFPISKENPDYTNGTQLANKCAILLSMLSTNKSTVVTAGTPGSFDKDIPYNLYILISLGALGNTTAWTTGQYIILGNASESHWNSTTWVAGKA